MLLAAAILSVSSCGTDPAGPRVSFQEVVGSYEATTFTATNSDGTTDFLANGGSINLTLASDGTTSGRLQATAPDGSIDADLAGTWAYNSEEGTVALSHAADTFLRDMSLVAERTGDVVTLDGVDTFAGLEFHVTLAQI